jgi:hypothetical protein
MQRLPRRHPARYTHQRYGIFHKLLRMKAPYKVQNIAGPDSPLLVVWRVGDGMQVGILKSLAELLARHPSPSEDFYRKVLPFLQNWTQELPAWEEHSLNAAGVWGGDMEMLAELRVAGMWERWARRNFKLYTLRSYAINYAEYKMGQAEYPSSKGFSISKQQASKVRQRVNGTLMHHQGDFDASKIEYQDLIKS